MNRLLLRSFVYGVTAILVSLPVGVARAGILDDLLVHLKLDEDYTDASGRENHGSAIGEVPLVAGRIGDAAKISNDPSGFFFNYITLGAPSDLNFGAETDFSISLWARFSDFSGDPVFVSNKNWNSGGNTGYALATGDDGQLQWNYREQGQNRQDLVYDETDLANNLWHHLAVTVERGQTARTYLDGRLVGETLLNSAAGSIDAGMPTNLGQDGTGFYTDGFNGAHWNDLLLDDVGIWGRVLSDAEVFSIHDQGQANKNLTNASASKVFKLVVNAITGSASIENDFSTQPVNIDGYMIQSASGALNPAGWNSFEESGSAGSGWAANTNASSAILGEANLRGSFTFTPGKAISLGDIFSRGKPQDLVFEYLVQNELTPRLGIIEYVSLQGDANGDGKVNLADFIILKSNFGSGTSLAEGDFNGDGKVNFSDFIILRSNFGKSAGAVQVPEPAGVVLLVLGLGGLGVAAVRRRR